MRILSMLAALVLVSSPAFAQNNNATTDQTGDGNQATIGQAGSVLQADVVQIGDQNAANVTQAAQNNSTLVEQGVGGGIATNNSATVSQSGSLNDGVAHGATVGAHVGQGVSGGDAMSTQAIITQVGTDGFVEVLQGYHSIGTASGAAANVSQGGAGNFAYVVQGDNASNVGGSVSVTQASGTTDGIVAVYQGHGGTMASQGDQTTVTQNSGSNNFAQIAQGAEYWDGSNMLSQNNLAVIDQDGNDNQARVNQATAIVHVPVVGGTASNNVGVVDQFGNGNDARLSQGIDGFNATGGVASIVQLSDLNTATTVQAGIGNTSSTTQQ